MLVFNMHEAKTRLSELVRLVEAGEKVILARNGEPVVELVPTARRGRRKGGLWRGKASISPDFDEPMPELEKLFSGE